MPRVEIRNAVIHLANEQPLLADLFELPAPTDVGLRCTNLRTLSGKRPVFADRSESIFFFPYAYIRFIEVLPGSEATAPLLGDGGSSSDAVQPEPEPAPEPEPELELDEDFLRRIREV